MKNLLLLLLTLCWFQLSYASSETANIYIKISGALADNRYFLCIPNIGCLSILAAERGKIYPVIHPFKLYALYITNLDNARVYYEGLPSSCQGTIDTNKSVRIYGRLSQGANKSILIRGLHCTIT